MRFHDHFSGHAQGYADARPRYPDALFSWLAALAPARRLAWDAGCGNGQAALGLGAHFERVVATDPSHSQIALAQPHPRVEYRIEPAEDPSLELGSVDLACVAQALHWMDLARLVPALRRALQPEGVFAAITYQACSVSPAVDAVFRQLLDDRLGPWWPPERVHVDTGYRDLALPIDEVRAPRFAMREAWPLPRFLAYLRSWSACQRCLRETGRDEVEALAGAFADAWGDPDLVREVRWPLVVRAGRLRAG
jgi:SAM-dependent methyltransferase